MKFRESNPNQHHARQMSWSLYYVQGLLGPHLLLYLKERIRPISLSVRVFLPGVMIQIWAFLHRFLHLQQESHMHIKIHLAMSFHLLGKWFHISSYSTACLCYSHCIGTLPMSNTEICFSYFNCSVPFYWMNIPVFHFSAFLELGGSMGYFQFFF